MGFGLKSLEFHGFENTLKLQAFRGLGSRMGGGRVGGVVAGGVVGRGRGGQESDLGTARNPSTP